jgi:restriction endonuclease S subunit
MAGEWQTLTIDEIKAPGERSIAIGPFGSRMKADAYVPSGVPVIRGNNISDTRALVGDFVFVSERTADELSACNVRAGDLVFPHRGAIGQVAIVPEGGPERYMLSTSLMKLTCDTQRVNPKYVFYFFRSALGRHALLQHASTVGTPGIGQPLASLRSIRLPVPPLPEQRAIAHILGTLDDKIELNRRMSETLEAIARALFHSWFVAFDPVRRNIARSRRGQPSPGASRHPLPKGEGRDNDLHAQLDRTHPSPSGRGAGGEGVVESTALLPSPFGRRAGDEGVVESTALLPSPFGRGAGGEGVVESTAFDHLFPARLVNSELGEIPEGWEITTLPELIEVNPSRPLRKGQIAPYLDMANMPTRGHAPDEVIERPFGSGMRFINGDTLVARITPCLENGKTAFVDFLQDKQVGWGSTEYIVLRPRSPLPDEFAYCLARSDSFREFAIQSMTGTSGRQRVQADSLAHYRLPRVPERIAEAFGHAIRPLFARSSTAAGESRTLAALRDALLPKLISGELRVRDPERFCERVEA